jgi:hypothetical protein
MYFSIDCPYGDVKSLFEQLLKADTTKDFYASVENVGIEQQPSAEINEDFELPCVENVPKLAILPTNSEVSNLHVM